MNEAGAVSSAETGPARGAKAARLSLLLSVAVVAWAAWLTYAGQAREAALAQRVSQLESQFAGRQASQDEAADRWQRELRGGLKGLEGRFGEQLAELSGSLEALDAQVAAQRRELARFSAADRDNWRLAETGHLLRLANQRLVMAGDSVAAQALLNSADAILRELEEPALRPVRAAIRADIAALRAVPKVDLEGIYLRLAAVIEQAEQLVIFQLPEQQVQPAPETDGDWRDRLQHGYQAALRQLSDYIIIRRRDVPMQALMDPQWEGLVRLNLRMLLEQAQVALLSGHQTLYATSLAHARSWVTQFEDSDTAAAQAIATELDSLAALRIEVPQPNISRSLQALDAAVEQRLQAEGDS